MAFFDLFDCSTNEVDIIKGRNLTGSISSYRFETTSSNFEPKIKTLNQALTASEPVHLDISPDQTNLIVAS